MTPSQWGRLVILVALLVFLVATTGIWGLVVLLGIVGCVFLHELGHYVAAKRAGMLVTEFFLGFGPRIWSFTRGETTYGLKLIPAGAYVRIIGMSNLEEVPPADEGRAFRQAKFSSRFSTVVAGPAMNFLIAFVLIWILLAVVGAPHGSLSQQVDKKKWVIDEVFPGTGAQAAGLRKGDRVTAVDGHKVAAFDDLSPLVALGDKASRTVSVTYVRQGVTRVVPVKLHPYYAASGQGACCVGISPYFLDSKRERVNPIVAVPRSVYEMGALLNKTGGGLVHFLSASGLRGYTHQVTHAQGDRTTVTQPTATTLPNRPVAAPTADTSAGNDRLISLVGIFQIGTGAASNGASALLVLFVLVNISLGVVNMLPLLPFDGGHAMIAVYEKVQERRRHVAGRYFADIGRLMPLTYVVVAILVGIFVTTTYLDIANPLKVG